MPFPLLKSSHHKSENTGYSSYEKLPHDHRINEKLPFAHLVMRIYHLIHHLFIAIMKTFHSLTSKNEKLPFLPPTPYLGCKNFEKNWICSMEAKNDFLIVSFESLSLQLSGPLLKPVPLHSGQLLELAPTFRSTPTAFPYSPIHFFIDKLTFAHQIYRNYSLLIA